MIARLQVEHDKFVAESEKRLSASATEAEGLRRALDEAEKATAAAAEVQRAAEARAGQAEQVARECVANLTVRPKQCCVFVARDCRTEMCRFMSANMRACLVTATHS